MTQQTQAIPQLENENLLAKIFTSKRWQKKLSNQNMNYQWIPCDQSQIQNSVNQVQVNLPNAYVDSCESDFFTFSMKMKITADDMQLICMSKPGAEFANKAPNAYMIVQYKNAVYMITTTDETDFLYDLPSNKILERFVQAIEDTKCAPNSADLNWNTPDFGYFVVFIHGKTNSSGAGIITTDTHDGIAVNDNSNPEQQIGHVETEANGDTGFKVKNAQVYTTYADIMQEHFGYQKLFNLPYNSACFLDRSILNHQNVDKSKPLQQINRLIYRQQYNPIITQQYMNQHWYEYYGNNTPQTIYTNIYDNEDPKDIEFSFTVYIPMNKIFWMWQQDFLPLFKLKNPLNLQFVLNTKMMREMFEVITHPRQSPGLYKGQSSADFNQIHGYITKFIDYNQIVFYNIGVYLLVCSDTVMEKKLIDELNNLQGIVLPQTQTWVESYKTNIKEERQFMTNVGFNCLTNLQLSLYADTNQAYYRGYSTLKDVCTDYKVQIKDDNGNPTIVQFLNPQKGDFLWYAKQLSFYMPQITFNAKQTFIGQKFMNSIPLFMSINNRGQDTDDQNPFNENLFDYFNVLNIRYEQFTDKYIENVNPEEMNYSGVSIQKQNNNFITCLLSNYNSPDYSSSLVKYDGILYEAQKENEYLNGILQIKSGVSTDTYFVQLLYKYKQILQIDQAGNLTQMIQEYML